jgi:hypothetical protein
MKDSLCNAFRLNNPEYRAGGFVKPGRELGGRSEVAGP